MAAPSAATMQKWRCDVCRTAVFDTFVEAERHEAKCVGIPATAVVVPSPQSASSLESTAAEAGSTTATTSSSKRSGRSKESKVESKKRKPTKSREVSPEVLPRSSEASSDPTKAKNKTTKKAKTTRKEKPTTLLGHFGAGAHSDDRESESDAPRKNAAASKPKQALHSFFAPRKAKLSAPAKRSSPTPGTAAAVNPFFGPRSAKRSKPVVAKGSGSDSDEVKVVGHSRPGKPKGRTKKPSTPPVTLETAEATANALAAMVNSRAAETIPVAGIFTNKSMKQLMEEQRRAEFQARRRLQRQQEQTRDQKRAAAIPSVPKATPTTWELPEHCKHPLAPRFPVPSHVVPDRGATERRSLCARTPFARKPGPSAPTNAPVPLRFSPTDLDPPIPDDDSSSNLLEDAFADLLVPSSSTESSASLKHQLWSDRYGLQHNSYQTALVGTPNLKQAERLQKWIQNWCLSRQEAMERMKERQRKLKRDMLKGKKAKPKPNYKKEPKDPEDLDLAPHNVYLLTGPPGSGKTSLVHSVARASGCKLVEINTTAARNGTTLKHQLQEATQSCSTSDLFQQQQQHQQESFFAAAKTKARAEKCLCDSDSDSDASIEGVIKSKSKSKKISSPVSSSSVTVILIDEVDLIYEAQGDYGFWNALASMAKTALCPIILTANSYPSGGGMATIRHQHLHLNRPTPAECTTKLLQVCRQEGIRMLPGLGPEAIRERLSSIARVGRCDLRRILNQLQWFATTQQNRPVPRSTPTTERSTEEEPAVPSAHSRMPTIRSVTPHRVPADQYSILTIHGTDFGLWVSSEQSRNWRVQLGRHSCQARVMDDETLLVLCPPCPLQDGPDARIAPICSVVSPGFGSVPGVGTQWEDLIDGSQLPGSRRLFVEYLDDIDESDNSVAGETEFEDHAQKSRCRRSTTEGSPSSEEGQDLWKKALNEEEATNKELGRTLMMLEKYSETRPDRKKSDEVSSLEQLAKNSRLMSDAALLESLQEGLPFLSGACPGFGYDLTEEGGSADCGKLRMHDQGRPPSEERLYSLGWKDNCYFHGDAETYLTLPRTACERHAMVTSMQSVRGNVSNYVEVEGSIAAVEKEEGEASELENLMDGIGYSMTSEEDMYIPVALPPLLASLPEILKGKNRDYSERIESLSRTERQGGHERFVRHCMKTMFKRTFQISNSKTKGARLLSREVLMMNHSFHGCISEEFQPMLCRMAAIEESFGSLESTDETDGFISERQIRSKRRRTRKHYFDGISMCLKLDEMDESSTAVFGQRMAHTLLTHAEPTQAKLESPIVPS